jgi:hypothetical protein
MDAEPSGSSDTTSAAYLIKQVARERGIQDGSLLILDSDEIQKLVEGISSLDLTERELATIAKEQACLKSLDFSARPRRHDDIPMAHKMTFQWILDPSSEHGQQDDANERLLLLNWLKHGKGIFWVSGKAGSGKSTLMRFIADHERTRRYLEEWAEPNKLAIATHFFWTAGTPKQKSQEGLLRALLYDIFRVYPEQMARVIPQRWSKTGPLDAAHSQEWSNRELLETLRALGRHRSSTRYCMFIDGLDEFDGDHFEICQVLRELSTSENFKFCLSSRPWNVFEDAFGMNHSHKLYIHNLTRQDILAYTQSRLREHPQWNERQFPGKDMESVVHQVTERAHGVFLWVFLVTRSLRDGLVNGDTIWDLQRRLESLPTDLEHFFQHMLEVIDPLYHKNMARTLRIAVNAKQALELEFYHMLEYEDEDKDFALNRSTESHTTDKLDATLDQCRRRMNARCGGLLEIKQNRVEFLHRTVRDFLLTKEVSDYIYQKSGQDFMVNLSTLKGFVFLFRCWMQTADWISLADDEPYWRQGLKYANDALDEYQESALMHLDAVEGLYQGASGRRASDFMDVSADFIFRSEVLAAGVDKYVLVKMDEDPDFFNNPFEWPLYTAIVPPEWSQGHINIIAKFLEHGHDPNEGDYESAWCLFLRRACGFDGGRNFTKAISDSMFSKFLRHGAKKDVRVCLDSDETTFSTYEVKPQYPVTLFVTALFNNTASHKFPHQCLSTLEEFWTPSAKDHKLQLEETLGRLQVELQRLDNQAAGLVRLRFLARVTQNVLKKASLASLATNHLVPDLLAVFQSAGAQALVALASGKEREVAEKGISRCSPLKRRMAGETSSSPCKRPSLRKTGKR